MTDAEKRLWSKVRLRQLKGYQFFRQRVIGNYIVDFYCPGAKLVIEVDGSQHYLEDGAAADRKREGYLNRRGLKVLRFTDTEVLKNIEGVIENLLENMGVSE